jgi:2-dehydro-3-deoxyglucarate aldolase/4-hydroxy-2-oxoheptanedioate aldolase
MKTPPLRIGTWLSAGSPVVAELAGECGFDWVLIDLEHGCEPEAALTGQLRALRGSKAEVIVRVGAPYPDLIGRVLDWGANGIMVPHVNTPEEARKVLQAVQYPPKGLRGLARTVRAYGYGLRPRSAESPEPTVIVQIETIGAVEKADEIAAVPGVDVVFVGPADLNLDLQAFGSKVPFDECLQRVVAAAAKHGKASGILLHDPADTPKMKQLGFTRIAIGSDITALRAGFLKNLEIGRV